MVSRTRRLLARLEKAAKDIPRLKESLQKYEDEGLFDGAEFRPGGPRFRLGELWQERKDYPVLFWTSELAKRRARFEAAVQRGKEGYAEERDPATILATYEFAGKLLGLPAEDGRFVESQTGVGPEAVVTDLTRIKEGVSGLRGRP